MNHEGKNNPNYRNAAQKFCVCCSTEYFSYNKTSKYCSHKCYVEHQKTRITELAKFASKQPKTPKTKLGYKNKCCICNIEFRNLSKSKYCLDHKKEAKENQKKKSKRTSKATITTKCNHCQKEFSFLQSSNRKFCSYQCFLDNGGAWRAGLASKGATMKYGAKKDANHNEIVDALKKAGASVIDLSTVGNGCPDLIVGLQSKTILMEIKNPKTSYGRRGLNKNQIKWKEQWIGGTFCVVDSPEAALRMLGVMRGNP